MWLSNALDLVPRRARAALVLLIEVVTVAIIVAAVVAMPMPFVAAIVTIDPPNAKTSALTVIFEVPSAFARDENVTAPVLMRLVPLKSALVTALVIWSRRALKSSFSAERLAV